MPAMQRAAMRLSQRLTPPDCAILRASGRLRVWFVEEVLEPAKS